MALSCGALFFAQNAIKDSLYILTSFDKDEYIYEQIDGFKSKRNTIQKKLNGLFVYDVVESKGATFLKGYYLGKENYLEHIDSKRYSITTADKNSIENIEFTKNLINNLNVAEKDFLKENARNKSIILLSGMKTDSDVEIDKMLKNPISIVKAVPTDDYSMTGAKFQVYNLSKKTIKYITFNFYGENPVGDKVVYRQGKYNVSRQGIGPIKPSGGGSWTFDSVWLTDVVETLELTSVNIQYMDGATKLVKITDAMWLDEDALDENKELTKLLDEALEIEE